MVNLAATTRLDFRQVNTDETKLFSVRAGVPASDALSTASCFMGVANSLCKGIGNLNADDVIANTACDLREIAFAASYLIEFAQAVVDSIKVKP